MKLAFGNLFKLALVLLAAGGQAGCLTESHRVLKIHESASAGAVYDGLRSVLVVGNFENRSSYMRGLFSDGVDRLGGQARAILIGQLKKTRRFDVVDRGNLEVISREAKMKGRDQALLGADYAVIGDVVEFGRREVGGQLLFGILGSGRRQVAYSKVAIHVVDVLTSEVVWSAQGAGECALSHGEFLGFGVSAAYDSTLNGKVLELAVDEAVDRLVDDLDQGNWHRAR